MDLKTFKFPKLTDGQIVFSIVKTDPKLLEEAKRRGFDEHHNPYNRLFSQLFFKGGQLNFKKDLDPEFKAKASTYLRAFMGSFEPKHENKEAICAMLLSELVNIEE